VHDCHQNPDGLWECGTFDDVCGKRVLIPSGEFLMGSDAKDVYPTDGEGPVRKVKMKSFEIDACETSNKEFKEFFEETHYVTEAEQFGWSFVFQYFISTETLENITLQVADAPHWLPVEGATWLHPEEPNSNIDDRLDHPVVHVSWSDAKEYCNWKGGRLPTEAEWEYAARGGKQQKRYPWGDDITSPNGEYFCNFFQGAFPHDNTVMDGYAGTAPGNAFPPNGYSLYNMAGNVWEWCEDDLTLRHTVDKNGYGITPHYDHHSDSTKETRKVQKGGSYLCHRRVCHRFRNSARIGNTPDSSAGNSGFRCAYDVPTNPTTSHRK